MRSFRRLKRRSKTKNFLSISFSASRWRGGGRRREKNARKFFGFCTRSPWSVSEAHWFASPRNRSVRGSFKPPRAPRVRLVVKILRILPEIHSNFVQYTPPKLEIGIRSRNGVGAKRRHKRIPPKNSRIQKVFPRSAWLTRLPIQFYE